MERLQTMEEKPAAEGSPINFMFPLPTEFPGCHTNDKKESNLIKLRKRN